MTMKTKRKIFAALAFSLALCPRLSRAQVPPGAVRFTDLACHRLDDGQPRLGVPMLLQHLNPLIAGIVEQVFVQEPQQLCTPVRKNDQVIPPDVIDFVSYLDLKCYRVEGSSVLQGRSMMLTHLNPLLAPPTLPPEFAQLYRLTQLCVPVNKLQDGQDPQPIPDTVIDFIRNVDLGCYEIFDQSTPLFPLQLTELNPMFPASIFPPTSVTMYHAQQLCLPVQKSFDGSFPPLPPPIKDVVSQLDFLRYEIFGDIYDPFYFLGLRHLNPLLVDFPDEQLNMHEARQLMVPVHKEWSTIP
jgi:hypothetical protein